METSPLATTLALGSLLLGLTAAALFFYIALSRRRKHTASRATAARSRSTAPPPPSPMASGSSARKAKPKQYSLFVIFNQPSTETDKNLTRWLQDKSAVYDPLSHVFHIAGEQPSSPITVANAFPPGEMPDLMRGEGQSPIKGISLLVKPPLRRRRNQQMIAYVELAKEMRELFDGDMLDSERAPATEETYADIING